MYLRPRPRPTQRTSQLAEWKAPVAGLIANRNLATPKGMDGREPPGASVLENFFPTARGAVMRRGSEVYATLEEDEPDAEDRPTVREGMTYNFGSQKEFFVATTDTIYDVTLSTAPVAVMTGLTGGEWVSLQFSTSGGTFLIAVNGLDRMMIYDGTYWYPVGSTNIHILAYDGGTTPFTIGQTVTGGTSTATAVIRNIVVTSATVGVLIIDGLTGNFQNNEAITDGAGGAAVADGAQSLRIAGLTGVSTVNLAYVWSYKNRLFFVEKNTLSAWYLAVDAITGAATALPLGGVFNLGGTLLFGSSWSIESSDGLDSRCVFITEGGEDGAEVAVYAGINPSDPNQWAQIGVYRIGKPMGKTAHMRAGGDLVIATDIGLIPLSVAVQRDMAALAPSALSHPIEDEWAREVGRRSSVPWKCKVWPTGRLAVVMLPTITDEPPKWFVVNVRTGGWTIYTGWDATCVTVWDDRLFFGSSEGRVVEANVTGFDQGATYSATFVPLFDDLKTPAALKIPSLGRAVLRAPVDLDVTLGMQSDFVIDLPVAPPATPVPPGSTWGTGIWGDSVWGEEATLQIVQEWVSIAGEGYALAPALIVTSGSLQPLDAEIVRIETLYTRAEIIT